jgi:dTDP-4-amino-4,6-dideoxygalactose transaminase
MSAAVAPPRRRVPLLELRTMHEALRAELDRIWSESVDGSGFIGGAPVAGFEDAWARACGRRHAIGVANGTDAIALTLLALGIGRGDEVIVPANTFIATAEAVLMASARPRFVDVDPETHLMRAGTAEPAIGPSTKAIIAVDLHGNVPNMAELAELADAHGLALIEDAAQAHGSSWRGRPAGSFGVASCFSFYPGKNLGAFGDGGAVVTDDEALASSIRSIANHGRAPESGDVHRCVGLNSRLDALQAGVLSAKLPFLAAWNERRMAIAARYDEAFRAISNAMTPVTIEDDVVPTYHHYVVRTGARDRVRMELDTLGIDTGVHYPTPCHLQAPYRGFTDRPLPVAERLASEILSLPIFPTLEDDLVDLVCESVASVSDRRSGASG